MSKTGRRKKLGAALDIGTTDIKGCLVNMSSGRELASSSVPNEQAAFGQDVITRLHFAADKGGLRELNKRVVSAVNRLLRRLAKDSGNDKDDIREIIAVGNSAMYHLMLMIKPDRLARAPFLPAQKRLVEKNASEMGLCAGRDAIFRFLPNISGFVGSDILASILAAGIHRHKRYSLIMDMGTNGEIALASKNKIFVTSCASGPAFEGRHIRCGMPAREGAIVRAKLRKGRLSFVTVAIARPKGISGSGLIDIVSILLTKEIIDRKGRMKKKEFVVYRRAGKRIYLTQNDIREVQIAKAALSAGIEVLRRKAKIELKDLAAFYITGSFGGGIDRQNARNIGLIPKGLPINKIKFLENSALRGAKKVLLEKSSAREIKDILAKCRHVELHKDKNFEEIFASAMHF